MPKLGHLIEGLYYKLVHRTSKMLFIKESGSPLQPTSPELRKLLIFGYKKTQIQEDFENILFKKQVSTISRMYQKVQFRIQ